MKHIELLAPAGTKEKLKAAYHFGADACYFAGKKFGLRAFAGNFDDAELLDAINYAHSIGKKAYITLNIIAHDSDFDGMKDYLRFLVHAKADAVIVADLGVFGFVRQHAPELEVHVSTQANIINTHAAIMMANMGAKRLILARELSLQEVRRIREAIPKDVDIECFVHGAMCISYSGRCLLSNYFTGRDSNRGACVQACRWNFALTESSRPNEQYPIEEDEKGTYILNSKDLCMIEHLDKLIDAGVTSLKIEGRMKSEFYVGVIINAYRRALEHIANNTYTEQIKQELFSEVQTVSHRQFTTGFYGNEVVREATKDSMPVQTTEFMAVVHEALGNNRYVIEHRNRFASGQTLEIVSVTSSHGKSFVVPPMADLEGNEVLDAKRVQQKLIITCPYSLKPMDMLRKRI